MIETDPATLNDLILSNRSLADAEEAGDLAITGDRARVERFLRLFPLPQPAVVVCPPQGSELDPSTGVSRKILSARAPDPRGGRRRSAPRWPAGAFMLPHKRFTAELDGTTQNA